MVPEQFDSWLNLMTKQDGHKWFKYVGGPRAALTAQQAAEVAKKGTKMGVHLRAAVKGMFKASWDVQDTAP